MGLQQFLLSEGDHAAGFQAGDVVVSVHIMNPDVLEGRTVLDPQCKVLEGNLATLLDPGVAVQHFSQVAFAEAVPGHSESRVMPLVVVGQDVHGIGISRFFDGKELVRLQAKRFLYDTVLAVLESVQDDRGVQVVRRRDQHHAAFGEVFDRLFVEVGEGFFRIGRFFRVAAQGLVGVHLPQARERPPAAGADRNLTDLAGTLELK